MMTYGSWTSPSPSLVSIACFLPPALLCGMELKRNWAKHWDFSQKFFPTLKKCCFSEGAPAFTASSMNEVDSADAWIYQFDERTNLFITHKSEFISTLRLFYNLFQNGSMNCSWRKSQSLMSVCSVTVLQLDITSVVLNQLLSDKIFPDWDSQ